MIGRPTGYYETDADGNLDVLCWCESEVVRVAAHVLRAGRTRSCGRHRCRSVVAC